MINERWDRIKHSALNKKSLSICCFILFVFFSAFKIGIFNQLIVESGSFPVFADCFTGYINKLILTGACSVILIRIRWRFVIIVFYAAQTLYILVNVMYYLSFQGYLHISQYIGLFSEAFDLITHAALPWDSRSLFAFIDLPFLAGILFGYRQLFELNKRYVFKPVLYCSSIAFIYYFYKWEVPVETPLDTMKNAYESDASVVKKYGLLTFNATDLFNFREAHSHIQNINYGPPVTVPDTGEPHPNILIFQVESLDANIISYKHRKEYVTPFLHALSNECFFFPYMLSYHLAGSTSDCEFSAINSVEPLSDFPSIKIRNYDYPNSMLKRCASDGYSVIAFHGNRGSYFNRNFAFKKMGFQKFFDMPAMGLPEIGWGASDESVYDFVRSQLLHQKQPFFYYCITMSSHEPYIFAKQYYRNKTFDDIKNGPMRNYLNSMSYVDNTLAKFIPAVRNACPNTVIFIFGDHTPSLPKCGYAKSMIEIDQRPFEFVPLFIITPGSAVYREKMYAVSFLDIAPTILAAARCREPIRSNGINLLSLPTRDREIPFCHGVYSRKALYEKFARKRQAFR